MAPGSQDCSAVPRFDLASPLQYGFLYTVPVGLSRRNAQNVGNAPRVSGRRNNSFRPVVLPAAAEELNAQSEALKDVVRRLTAMVGAGARRLLTSLASRL